jgi:hypothetical protein
VVEEQISKKKKSDEASPIQTTGGEEEEAHEVAEAETLLLRSHIYLYTISFEQIFTSLSYLGPLRQAMETYHSNPCPSAADAVNLYNAFSVNNSGNTLQEWNIIDTVIPKSSMARRR